MLAEKKNHHPEIIIDYGKTTSIPRRSKITERDVDLAILNFY